MATLILDRMRFNMRFFRFMSEEKETNIVFALCPYSSFTSGISRRVTTIVLLSTLAEKKKDALSER
jgi:hypothetical protein